jgi:phage tail-like protein
MIVKAETQLADPLRKFKYQISISGGGYTFNNLAFSKVGGLSGEYEDTEYREGGDNLSRRRLPGLMKWDDLTLERGVYTEDADLWEAFVQVANGSSDFRMSIGIDLLDPYTGEPARSWVVTRAWIKKYEEEDLDALSNDVLIERITIAHEGIDRI